ncbi:YqjD family protein [Aurantimonas sp. VKM B-3413]|uniref:DUF883 family protein n=1 Tax=Aurantimonas sp. VKM B-3413 TaxID=2779401 RepID=UPI001E55C251|nr:hypothetical protein [Aurantimonas sp. VKM B-3413]MCB8838105.1 hypothetical protein [Aurantimonas sp. VKM B-3413]
MASDTPSNDFTPGSATGSTGPEVHKSDLETQINRLREDVSGLSDALKSMAQQQADDARKQAYALRDDVRDRGERYWRQAQDTASELEEEMSERIRTEPIKSVLIAAGIGYLYARLFR